MEDINLTVSHNGIVKGMVSSLRPLNIGLPDKNPHAPESERNEYKEQLVLVVKNTNIV